MKLDNKGWGTLEMFLLSGGLFIALLVAVFFIYRFYGSMEKSIANRSYIDLEIKLEEAARNYIDENDTEVNGSLKISSETLKNNGYLINLKDKNDRSCSGYVSVSNIDGINQYIGYVSCKDYETRNY